MGRILLIGECMVEFSPKGGGDFKLGFAGDTFNTAWYLRQLMPADWTIQYFTNIGDDRLSTEMMAFIEQSGVDTSHVKIMKGMNPGLYVISLDNGERSFSYWRSDSAARTLADDPARLAQATQGADCVVFSGITLAILPEQARGSFLELMTQLRNKGVMVAFDPNIRKRLWGSDDTIRHWIGRGYAACSIALPSWPDETEIFGDADLCATVDRIAVAGVHDIIVKNGGSPSYVFANDTRQYVTPKQTTEILDTTSAGDSFNAAYLLNRLQGESPEKSVRRAHMLAARVIAGLGALILPQKQEGTEDLNAISDN
jgi:2-dehydro-3-deoxygluconokinase